MKLFKSLILSLIVTLILTTTSIFCQNTVKNDNIRLIPSGEVIGLDIELKYPYVYQRLSEDAKELEYGDMILSVKYKLKKVKSIDKLNEIMKLKNQDIIVEFLRNTERYTQKMTTDQLRMYVFKDNISGIGTITAINENGEFIGISHSIKIANKEIEFNKCDVFKTSYVQEIKSYKDRVGSLIANMTDKKIGIVTSMGEYGVKGKSNNLKYCNKKALQIGEPKKGKAYIYCKTPVTNKLKLHEIEIVKVGKTSSEIKIVDESLIKYRGGAVVGMSGSPIIQDDKIVGGLRSIVIKNPTKAYIANINSMLYYN